ncbi:LuxR C-terminal-related transcriptional regulator [Paractinoplanes rhizophilus]|uniref:LuxR C-terminal-related transcriptional regulator n=1 Tax=Paractinoplanes rhizophilus TaxID=1416877 RepID=A0ABW2I086_9ACTN
MPVLHHLPPELSSFVGRAGEVEAIGEALAAGRVLTLAGPGGCGKTRLAIRACRKWPEVFWVALERESGAERVAHRVADALDVLLPSGIDPLPALVAALRDRELLIVLDNCEHVLAGAAEVSAALLAGCPGIAVLATSQAPLGIAGERVWRVPPMALADALELLLARAGAEGPQARSAARRVCDRLDRLPLALELAAGWTGTLSMAQIADSLGSPLAMLDGGARTAPFRQQTLEGSMRWSHDLLDEDERALFRRLAVFEPGFTADDVVALTTGPAALAAGPAAVAGGPAIATGSAGPSPGSAALSVGSGALKALRGLVDKSLVVADTTGAAASYRMLGVVRAYALDRLAAAGETARFRDRHLDLQLDLLERLTPLLDTDRDTWRARVGAAYADIRAAIEWGLSQQDASRARRLAASCGWLWHLEGRGGEGVRLLRRAAERGGDERTPLQADVLAALALVGDTGLPGIEAYQVAYEARELAVEAGAPAAARISRALTAVGKLMVGLDAAIAEAQAARDEAVRAGDAFVADSAETFIGLVHVLTDDYPEAIARLEAAVAGPLARGDRGIATLALSWLALATARTGDLRRAGELAEQAVRTAAPLRDFHWTGSARCILAEIRILRGRPAEAVEALAPIDRLLTDDLPFITGWERTKAMLALENDHPAEAVEWCRREGRWQPEPSDDGLAPETRLVLATALRRAGDREAAARTLRALWEAPLTDAMPRIRAGVLDEQALLARADDPERALRLHHEALRIRIDHGLVLGFLASLESLADLNKLRGADETAATLAGAAERTRADFGAATPARGDFGDDAAEPVRADFTAGSAASRAAAGAEAARRPVSPEDAAVERGRAMDVRTAVAYAAKARGPRRRPDAGWDSLTPAELSVVELAVQGLNNVEIAARLFVGRGTVKTHLAHVYAKLQVANRTDLARLATQRRTPS